MSTDLKIIKKHFGEKMSQLCRELFPTLLEQDGLLSNIFLSTFADNHILYDDIVNNCYVLEFKDFIYDLTNVEETSEKTIKTPTELLSEAGYDLYECQTEEDIQKFKKYYAQGESLCTFYGGRLGFCYVFFAVKKNVDSIKRKDFLEPQRQDEYGTSVISIQFYRGKNNNVSIKNRYNHTVNNPDATFCNNLDCIIPGLTKSFADTYHLNINGSGKANFDLAYYIMANDGKYYKYNYEEYNMYFCPDNIIINNGVVQKLEKSKYLVVDYFVIDLENKNLLRHTLNKSYDQSFIDIFQDVDKIEITKEEDTKIVTIMSKRGYRVILSVDKENKLVGYENNYLTSTADYFLLKCAWLKELKMKNLQIAGNYFISEGKSIEKLDLPNLQSVGDSFLARNNTLTSVDFDKLEIAGSDFLISNQKIERVNLPELKFVGNGFLNYDRNLTAINLPKLESCGDYFLSDNSRIRVVNLPELKHVGFSFLCHNKSLKHLELPELLEAGQIFLRYNRDLETFYAPKLQRIGLNFMEYNLSMQDINIPFYILTKSKFISQKDLVKQLRK